MLWSFKALAIFSPDASHLLRGSSPPEVSSESPALDAPAIPVTKPDTEDGRDLSWLCACGYQQLDFCPYCEYDQTRQAHEPFVPESPSLDLEGPIMTSIHHDFLNQPPPPRKRKRKLRKFRPHYQQLRYEALDVEAVVASRPDSVLSTHSRTPLLNRALPSNQYYPPLPSDCRTPKRLEKREKMKRSLSISESSSQFTSLSNSSSDRVVRSKSFLQVGHFTTRMKVSIDQPLHRQKLSLPWARDPNRYLAALILVPSYRWRGLVRLYLLSGHPTYFFRTPMGFHRLHISSLGPHPLSRSKKLAPASIYDLNCQHRVLAKGAPCFARRRKLASNNH